MRKNTSTELPQLLTIAAAAEAAGCHPRTIRRRIADGDLPAVRVGPRLIRVDRAALVDMLTPRGVV